VRRGEDEVAEVAAEAPAVPQARDARADTVPSMVDNALSERDRELLSFENQWWKRAGAKEQAIRERFGVSATRYYQILNALLDEPAALAHDPVLVQRLRRLRQHRGHRSG
jgi:uncharacterized protein DUF3263